MKKWCAIFIIIPFVLVTFVFSSAMVKVDSDVKKLRYVSTFSTSFYNSDLNRSHNVALACSKFSWKLIYPGQEISFNEIVGKRTVENGFAFSKVIENGEYVEGVGGGVCQVSTTLYNAWIRADLEVKSVKNHSLAASYVEMSQDSTVSEVIDLVLKNDTDANVIVNGYVKNKSITFDIYAKPLKYDIRVKTVIDKVIDPPQPDVVIVDSLDPYKDCIFKDDNGLEYALLKKARQGYKTSAFKEYYQNNKLIKTNKIREDYYSFVKGKVAVLLVE